MSVIDHAYSRWCKSRFAQPTEQAISDLEKRIAIQLPDHYRRFLLDWNGGIFKEPAIIGGQEDHPIECLTFLSGIDASNPIAELGNERDLALFDDNDPPIILPIGRTSTGCLLMIATVTGETDDGTVFLRTIGQENFYLCDTMDEFFTLLSNHE
ncbi:MAG: cell-wall [Planctomycetaceae bacterium]|nr:cell-wall [Planctomycetaceae bacterium]